ncbi:hypothetical protein M947_08240 [Sulfurimonas hongkongensis]|uniref:PepSY domain-containing protein n=1 Tax=Sulfurimonas hongkongensis TaxID=1172190 RepID=T0JDT9_9BACT|nr:hypothetical protein [Sulfurimonas hongkongensis]EQB39140.1 hypothetical protein M947_08240 [Sulfurimonas hongkongensis]
MKYLATLLLVPLFALASPPDSTPMTPLEHSSIHGYNKAPLVNIKSDQKKRELRNIDEKEAKEIIKKETNEDASEIELTHVGIYLVYKAKTKNYKLQINAIDGVVMKKEPRD